MDLLPCTDPLLLESKSISPKQRGHYFEKFAEKYFLDRGYILLKRNYRTPFSEVDLIFRQGHSMILVEVKSMKQGTWSLGQRVSRKQAGRLKRALHFIQEKHNLPTRLHLAVVSHRGGVQVYEDFLCDLLSS